MSVLTMSIASAPNEILMSLPPDPESAGVARRELARRGLGEDVDHTVLLLATEIIGNSVRHARIRERDLNGDGEIIFFARVDRDFVRVEVADPGPGFDPEIRHSASGVGLRLVDKLASRWGTAPAPSGFRVWFEVDRRSGRFARA